MIQRRGFLAGLGALLAAPAIIRTPGLLMPVRPVLEPVWFGVDWASTATHYRSMALFDAEGRLMAYHESAEISDETWRALPASSLQRIGEG